MSVLLPTDGFFQLGYVTTNLERAIATCQAKLGMSKFLTFDTSQMRPGKPVVRVGLCWRESTMVELIEPEVGHDGIYAHALNEAQPLSLHHLGYLVSPERLAILARELNDAGIETSGSVGEGRAVSLLYADTRMLLGHYCEFIALGAEGVAMFKSVPGFTTDAPSIFKAYLN